MKGSDRHRARGENMIVYDKEQEILKMKTAGFNQAQIRLLKSLFCILHHTITTSDESQFFSGSAESLKICATLVKQSEFIAHLRDSNDVPYAEQALEYSIDILQESMGSSKLVRCDN